MKSESGRKNLVVLIPTRNRHSRLGTTIDAALALHGVAQDFNVNIVISDNSDDRNLILPIVDKLPVKVIFPPTVLSMSEHWDWAINSVSADYYALITDRSLIMAEEFYGSLIALEKSKAELVSHSFCGYNDYRFPYLLGLLTYTKDLHLLSTADILAEAKQACFWSAFPRAMNCIFSNNLKNAIKSRYGRIFSGVAPDFNFALKVCSEVPSFLFHDVPGFMSVAGNLSNGRSYSTGTAGGNADFNRMSLSEGVLATPFPHSKLPINIILHECCSVIDGFTYSYSAYENAIIRTLGNLSNTGVKYSLESLPESFRAKLQNCERSEVRRLFRNLFFYRRFPTFLASYPIAMSLARHLSLTCSNIDRRFCF